MLSKEFESDPRTDKGAKVIHHLRDTEEQRKYNDEHYEMFGFEIDENGNESFTYGKYVVFWTKEHHSEYHKCSEETRKKLSVASSGKNNAMYGKFGKNHPSYGREVSDETRKKLSIVNTGKVLSDTTKEKLRQINLGKTLSEDIKKKISEAESGEKHWNYGKHWSDEVKEKIGSGNRGKIMSEESKEKIRIANTGHIVSDETKLKISKLNSGERNGMHGVHISYKKYKEDGGTLSYREFQKIVFKDADLYSKYVTVSDDKLYSLS